MKLIFLDLAIQPLEKYIVVNEDSTPKNFGEKYNASRIKKHRNISNKKKSKK